MKRLRRSRDEVRCSHVVLETYFITSMLGLTPSYRDCYAALLEMFFANEIEYLELCPYAVLEFVAFARCGKIVREDGELLHVLMDVDEVVVRGIELVSRMLREFRRYVALNKFKLVQWYCESLKGAKPDMCRDVEEVLEIVLPRLRMEDLIEDLRYVKTLLSNLKSLPGRRASMLSAMIASYTIRRARSSRRSVCVASPTSIYSELGAPWLDVKQLRRRGIARIPT